MAAVANNPDFAKKVGVPQSVGKDFTAADKGIKIPKSGDRADLQRINSPKTNQGKNELFKKGGDTMATKKMSEKAWEGSAKDLEQDKKLAKKHGMSFRDWEKSSMDTKHDKQQTMAGLKRGGKAKRFDEGGGVDEQEDDTSALTAYTPPKVMPSRPVSKTPTATKSAAKPASNYSNEGRYKAPKSSSPTDVTKMSVSDRLKAARTQSREGTTDTRSVGERLRSAFGMAKGGMASGGSFRSSANGIAQRGKTRGKMC